MKYLYSALLLYKAEKEITVDAMKKVLKAAGVDVDESRVKTIVASMDEIDIEEYKRKIKIGLSSAIEIMNRLCKGIFKRPLRKKILDLSI